jgi:rhodanese-related sulfurtransferase
MVLRRLLLLLLTFSLIVFVGCSDDDDKEEVDEFALVTAVGDDYFTSYLTTGGQSPNIDAAGLKALIDADEDIQIIDWRSATDYDQAHIVGAVNMSLANVVANWDQLATDKTIINVCYTGQTASHATALMNLAGLEARNLLFGMCSITADAGVINGTDKWLTGKKDTYVNELETTANTATETYDFPTMDTGLESAAGIIKKRFADYLTARSGAWAITGDYAGIFTNPDDYFVVNYWPTAQYLDPGHIPGAYCFTPNGSLEADQMLDYLPTDMPIIVYCYTGQTSAQVTTYLRILGYDAYSLAYGINGFATSAMARYAAPTDATLLDIIDFSD